MTDQQHLPNWFVHNYLFNSDLEQVNTKKLLKRLIVAFLWLTLAIISLLSTAGTTTRIVVSFGYEVLGEYAHKVGNLCNVFFVVQYIVCQLIQFITYRSSNLQATNLLRPLTSPSNDHKLWDNVLKLVDITIIAFGILFAILSSSTMYGLNWWLIIYKLMIGILVISADSAVGRLIICNCLLLTMTCQSFIGKILELNLKLFSDGHRKKVKLFPVTTIIIDFQSICIDLNKVNRYWKKIILVVTTTVIPSFTTAIFVVLEIKSTTVTLIGLTTMVPLLAAGSLFYLIPAKVESKLRKCYPLMCQLLRHRPMNWKLKLKLLRLVKQFDNQISFTSWDANKLDYMDYYEFVFGFASNLILIMKFSIDT